jgi:hypothetical protein
MQEIIGIKGKLVPSNEEGSWWQGDQIGRILAKLVIVYFGQLIENYRYSQHFWATFFQGYGFAIISTKNGMRRHFGQLFHKLIRSPWILILRLAPIRVATWDILSPLDIHWKNSGCNKFFSRRRQTFSFRSSFSRKTSSTWFKLLVQGCQILLGIIFQNVLKCTKFSQNVPNGHKMYQITI